MRIHKCLHFSVYFMEILDITVHFNLHFYSICNRDHLTLSMLFTRNITPYIMSVSEQYCLSSRWLLDVKLHVSSIVFHVEITVWFLFDCCQFKSSEIKMSCRKKIQCIDFCLYLQHTLTRNFVNVCRELV